eukprot:scaffold15219_cov119-Skeletonema_dohrnii-CCMP3373.AAC.4
MHEKTSACTLHSEQARGNGPLSSLVAENRSFNKIELRVGRTLHKKRKKKGPNQIILSPHIFCTLLLAGKMQHSPKQDGPARLVEVKSVRRSNVVSRELIQESSVSTTW